jgi:two-component sensor histidine kinase
VNINVDNYIKGLADNLIGSYIEKAPMVTLNINAKDITLGIDAAIPCGLIINELISNSFKHAFPEDRKGEINITMKQSALEEETVYDLIISDNGIGIPEALDIHKTDTLGLQLVTTLVEHQLQGELDLTRNEGTKFHIRFRETSYKERH